MDKAPERLGEKKEEMAKKMFRKDELCKHCGSHKHKSYEHHKKHEHREHEKHKRKHDEEYE